MGRWSLALALVAGCFSETTDPSADGGSTGATTGTTLQCPIGARGCPCDGLACDAGLECHGPSHMCYEPDCERGALDCPCAEGLCLGSLECIDDFCMPPSTSGESTSTSTGAPDPTAAIESSTSTGLGDTGSSDPATSTTGHADDPCLACLKETAVCPCNESCQTLASCMLDGTDPGSCCANGPPGHAADWDAFVACAISEGVGSSRVDLQACKLEYSIVSPK